MSAPVTLFKNPSSAPKGCGFLIACLGTVCVLIQAYYLGSRLVCEPLNTGSPGLQDRRRRTPSYEALTVAKLCFWVSYSALEEPLVEGSARDCDREANRCKHTYGSSHGAVPSRVSKQCFASTVSPSSTESMIIDHRSHSLQGRTQADQCCSSDSPPPKATALPFVKPAPASCPPQPRSLQKSLLPSSVPISPPTFSPCPSMRSLALSTTSMPHLLPPRLILLPILRLSSTRASSSRSPSGLLMPMLWNSAIFLPLLPRLLLVFLEDVLR